MKKIMYACLWMIASIACKKDQALPEIAADSKVDTTSNYNLSFRRQVRHIRELSPLGQRSASYAYDDHGRLAFYHSDEYMESFNYEGDNKISIVRQDNQTLIKMGEWKAELNEKKAITKLSYYDGEGTAKSVEVFEYDDKGYMVKRKYFDQINPAGSYEEQYIIQNGLLKKEIQLIGDLPQFEFIYHYNTSRTALMMQSAYAYWVSPTLFGNTWLRVATSVEKKEVSTGKVIGKMMFDYKIDDEAYVVYRSTKDASGSTVSEMSIAY